MRVRCIKVAGDDGARFPSFFYLRSFYHDYSLLKFVKFAKAKEVEEEGNSNGTTRKSIRDALSNTRAL